MKRTRTTDRRLVFAIALGLFAIGCDDIVEDSSFQLWCGDTPCAWQVEAGRVAQAPTWHASDYGVALIDDPTAISQLVPRDRLGYGCMQFEVIASNERGSELRLELDFDDDGVLELERTLDQSDFETDVFYVGVPDELEGGLRVRLVKYGPGRAVIAQLRVQRALEEEGCLGPSP